jgi:Zn-dependent protease with chaperone function
MPILLVIFLVAACTPVAWPVPLYGPRPDVALTIVLALTALPLAGHLALNLWVVHALRKSPSARGSVSNRYSRLRRLLGLSHFALAILSIALGWGWAVQRWFEVELPEGPGLAPFAELLVPLPYVAGVFLAWLLHHDAEKALHTAMNDEEFWTRRGQFAHRLRPYLLLILFPTLLYASQQTLVRTLPELSRSTGMQIVLACCAPLMFLVLPLLAKPVLGLQSLPPGRHREQLEATAKRLKFRCADLLLWPTRRTTANAMVLGVLPQARYVVFTDHLLEQLDDEELDAVFGHEVGHVKHGHLVYYAAFLVLSMMVVVGAMVWLTEYARQAGWIRSQEELATWQTFPPLVVLAAYLFAVFGLVSRRCERQADLFGVRTVADARTEGHPLAAGVASLQRALSKVAYVNGLDPLEDPEIPWQRRLWARIVSWQHGSIADRIGFLNRLLEEPDLEQRSQRRITIFRWLVMACLIVAAIALGSLIEL